MMFLDLCELILFMLMYDGPFGKGASGAAGAAAGALLGSAGVIMAVRWLRNRKAKHA
jgi:hypothetical protein